MSGNMGQVDSALACLFLLQDMVSTRGINQNEICFQVFGAAVGAYLIWTDNGEA